MSMPDAAATKICVEPQSLLLQGTELRSIYRAIYYFDLFDYPARVEELAKLCGLSVLAAEAALGRLRATGLIEQREDYVFIPNRSWVVARRQHDELFFQRHYKRIKCAAWVLSHMPFVRGVFLTGRTSKGLLSEYDDFDFLIVAEKDRARLTWILLFLFRRLVSFNFRNANFKWFCCNYVLSEDRLALKERDPF